MKLSEKAVASLVADNLASVEALVKTDTLGAYPQALMACMADAIDDLISGRVLFLTLGLNQKKTSLLMTINPPGAAKAYVNGTSLEDLIWRWATTVGPDLAASLLDEP